MGEAANQEALASDPRGPANAAQSARLLYRRVVEMFPNSPLVPEAAWRAADILWQIEKADASTRPSAQEKRSLPARPDGRGRAEEGHQALSPHPPGRSGRLRPHRQQALRRLAGRPSARRRNRKFTKSTPPSIPTARAPRRLFTRPSTARPCSRTCMPPTAATRRADEAHNHAQELAAQAQRSSFPQSDYAWRAGALVYKLDEGVPVYGIDRE